MQISVTARKVDVTPELKAHAEQKVRNITKHLDRAIDARIVLSVEKYRHKAEVNINVNGFIIHGEEVSGDMYLSIDQVMHKLEAQIKKYKSKLNKRGRQRRGETSVRSHEQLIGPETGEETGEEQPVEAKIVRTMGFALKPMSPEEAVMQMELLGEDFLFYRDSISSEMNVVYRRKGGRYGLLMEPELG